MVSSSRPWLQFPEYIDPNGFSELLLTLRFGSDVNPDDLKSFIVPAATVQGSLIPISLSERVQSPAETDHVKLTNANATAD